MREGPEDLAEWAEGLPGGDQWTYRETDGLCPLKGPLPNNQIWGLMWIPSSVSSCKWQLYKGVCPSVGPSVMQLFLTAKIVSIMLD